MMIENKIRWSVMSENHEWKGKEGKNTYLITEFCDCNEDGDDIGNPSFGLRCNSKRVGQYSSLSEAKKAAAAYPEY